MRIQSVCNDEHVSDCSAPLTGSLISEELHSGYEDADELLSEEMMKEITPGYYDDVITDGLKPDRETVDTPEHYDDVIINGQSIPGVTVDAWCHRHARLHHAPIPAHSITGVLITATCTSLTHSSAPLQRALIHSTPCPLSLSYTHMYTYLKDSSLATYLSPVTPDLPVCSSSVCECSIVSNVLQLHPVSRLSHLQSQKDSNYHQPLPFAHLPYPACHICSLVSIKTVYLFTSVYDPSVS
ncbi:hypothetical protein DPX16_0064 [Anabarilius grahami]|uniref:Uncharacterized protein n=1 Tax=Anabarilius grahami TaxID=495550 RepID=A0A3N0YEX0_ANAGA|nr:hypothetical protein DPX16_0064 [Anabarilius grahami]